MTTTESLDIADLQVPKIGDQIRHGDIIYTVQGVVLNARRHVDTLDKERHSLKLQIVATVGPAKAEGDDGPYVDDDPFAWRL